MVIGSGSHPYFKEIENLEDSLSQNGIHSLYTNSVEDFDKLKFDINNFKGGKVLFYSPDGKVKHPATNASLSNLMHQHFTEKKIDFSMHHYSPSYYSIGDVFLDAQIVCFFK